jgi:hypothetical protein
MHATKSGAQFSPCRKWRYALWRSWHDGEGHLLVLGHNPSTANENETDPTLTRCIGFARDCGFQGVYMLNPWARVATNPADLVKLTEAERIGPENNEILCMYFQSAAKVLAAWGAPAMIEPRVCAMLEMFGAIRNRKHDALYCLAKNKNGSPKHPLYCKRADKIDLVYHRFGTEDLF